MGCRLIRDRLDPNLAGRPGRSGEGQAIYLATAPQAALLGPLVRSLYAKLGTQRGPETPDGVVARVVDGRTMYVNTREAPVTVHFGGTGTDVLTGERHAGSIELPAFGAALLR